MLSSFGRLVAAAALVAASWTGLSQVVFAAGWTKSCATAHDCTVSNYTQSSVITAFQVRPHYKGQILAAVITSSGLDLPFGVSWQIDGQKQIRVPIAKCVGNQCMDQLIINPQYIDALRKGSTIRLGVHKDGKEVFVNVPLTGFGPLLDSF